MNNSLCQKLFAFFDFPDGWFFVVAGPIIFDDISFVAFLTLGYRGRSIALLELSIHNLIAVRAQQRNTIL